MNAPDKVAQLNRLTDALDTYRPADIFAQIADRFSIVDMQGNAVSEADKLRAKIRALPGMRLDVEELEYVFGKRTLTHTAGSLVAVDYVYEEGEPARLHGAWEDCYPGTDETLDICSIITCEEFIFEDEDTGVKLRIPPCTDIGWMLTDKQSDALEARALDNLIDEFEEMESEAKITRYEDSHD